MFKDEKSYKSSKMKLCLSIICSYIVVIGSIALLICITYCAIKDKVSNIEFSTAIDLTNEYMEKYQNKITEISESIKKLEVPDETKKNIISSLYQFSTAFANFGSGVVNFIKGISKNVANIFIGLIIAFYIILDAEFFKEVWNNILLLIFKKKFRLKISTTFKEIDEVLSNFVRGQLLDCLIVAVVSILVLLSIKIEFAVVLGIFAGIANVIPYFGPIIGMIPAVIVALLSGEPLKALFAIIGLLIVQQIDGNILAPRIIGGTVGIHPVFVIIGIIIGAYYMGIIGMIIAVPICGMIKILLNKLIKYKKSLEEKNGTN